MMQDLTRFLMILSLLYISIVKKSNAITCNLGSGLTCSATGSCAVTSQSGTVGYVCSASPCSTLVPSYAFSDSKTVSCCTTNNCNTYTALSNSLTCYDNTTQQQSGLCSTTGSCYTISNGTVTYAGCSLFDSATLQATYGSLTGYTTKFCTTSKCNSSNNNSLFMNKLIAYTLCAIFALIQSL